jgi:hypothetical protein
MPTLLQRVLPGVAIAVVSLAGVHCADAGAGESFPSEGDTSSTSEALHAHRIDFNDPAENLKAFVKVRGSLDPNEEVVFYWTGNIYSFVPEATFPPTKTNKNLFKFEGYNIARFVPTADGYQMLSKEISFYEDPATGAILRCWSNPLNGKNVTVVPVLNDPVNFNWAASTWTPTPTVEFGDRVVWNTDVLLAYPNALAPALYPDYSAGAVYQGAELFTFFTSRHELQRRHRKSVSADITWSRVGQYLPFMQMGPAAGNVIYHTRGTKLMGGYDELPAHVRAEVEANYPTYTHAPTTWPAGQRNVTSWSYMRGLLQANQYQPTCQP